MSTTTAVVPASVQLAAKRGFVRTTAQAYASTIPAGGVSAAALIAFVRNPDPVVLACTAIAAVVSPPLAGFASWLSILSKGLPADYTAVVSAAPATLTPAAVTPVWPPVAAPAAAVVPVTPPIVAPTPDATAGSMLTPTPALADGGIVPASASAALPLVGEFIAPAPTPTAGA